MAASTAPILILTGLTVAAQSLGEGKPVDMRVVAAGGLTAGMAALAERALPDVMPALAWLALTAVVLVRVNGKPTPAERLLAWWQAPISSQNGATR